MIKYFRKTLVFYILVCLAGLSLSTLLFYSTSWTNSFGIETYILGLWIFQRPLSSSDAASLFYLLSLLLFVLLPALLIRRFSMKQFQKTLNLLLDACDPQKLLEQLSPLLTRGEENSSAKQLILSNYAMGLVETGKLPEAIKIMEELLTRPIDRKVLINKAAFYCNLATCYCKNGELDKAKEALQKGKEILMANKSHRYFYAYKLYFYDADHIILFYEGEYETALTCFKNALPLAKNRYNEVCIHYRLAKIYEKLGDASQQKEHLRFVADNGNTLKIAEEARQLLECA